MPRAESWDVGVPSWVDLSTPDVDAASRFYGALFGWVADGRVFRLRGSEVAGVGPSRDAAWTTFVTVESVPAVADAVARAGGTVCERGLFEDSCGAAFGLRAAGGAAVVNEPGALCWNELNTSDPKEAVEFYGAVFGWSVHHDDSADQAPYAEFVLEGRTIGGMTEWGHEAPAHWLAYFAVHDCDKTAAVAVAGGGAALVGPMDVPPGRFAILRDPQGAVFAVIALAA